MWAPKFVGASRPITFQSGPDYRVFKNMKYKQMPGESSDCP